MRTWTLKQRYCYDYYLIFVITWTCVGVCIWRLSTTAKPHGNLIFHQSSSTLLISTVFLPDLTESHQTLWTHYWSQTSNPSHIPAVNSLFFSSRKILVISIRVSNYLDVIILFLYYHCYAGLKWTPLVFRIVAISRSLYSILLGLYRDTCCMYLFLIIIHLELPGVIISIISL